MIAIPAIDIRDGCCVQLVGGSFDHERVRIADPVSVAQRWVDAGFTRLHVVDLDAAMGSGSNGSVVRSLIELDALRTQVGGGLRDDAALSELFRHGVEWALVGTRALKDRAWLRSAAYAWPERLIVAADARDGVIVADGWTSTLGRSVVDGITELNALPLAGVLVTTVEREGRMVGPDVALMRRLVAASRHPVIASGGVGTMDDLRALADVGVSACVIGMALYSGALDERAVAREFAA
jgi:phosphoribosylformimino-5-aminoimidazole carboxamide ribotide isomerase